MQMKISYSKIGLVWFIVFNVKIVAVSFIDRGSKSTQWILVADKLYHIMLYRVHLAMNVSGEMHWLQR
jgi:hypothetical protein